ncbi:MAG: glycosyltransferase [Candidatus Neomarinimicrobiota bacterium]
MSRFPAEDLILFVEPIGKGLPNRFTFIHEPPVRVITVPHIRAVASPLLNKLLDSKFVRWGLEKIAGLWLEIILRSVSEKPDIIVISNVFWSGNVAALRKRWPELPVVYECNDNPLGFPRTPAYKRHYVLQTIEIADLITTPHLACIPIDPAPYLEKIAIVTNGVDFNQFKEAPPRLPLASLPRPIIMYTGALSEWFDFNLVKRAADVYSAASIVLIGPIASTVQAQAQSLLVMPNVNYIPPVAYGSVKDYLHAADVCIIPFVANELTRPVVPNKFFEYAAAGKTTVVGHFNPDLKEFARWAYIAESEDDFIDKLAKALDSPLPAREVQQMASKYDWNAISRTFREHLMTLIAGPSPGSSSQ